MTEQSIKSNNPCMFDVVVIGAGVAGCTVARELARYDLRCIVLEAGNDIACGATRANSGIVHAGYDPKPDTNKAYYCARGARMYPEWAAELEFGYLNNGSLVLAFSDEDVAALEALRERATLNGVEVELLDAATLRQREPGVSELAIAALHAPTAGICDPYGVAFAAAENAAENGVEFFFGQRVVSVAKNADLFTLACDSGAVYVARTVVNAAGVFADEINNHLSATELLITPLRGEYMLYDTIYGSTFSHTMFQAPGPLGKGILVTPTVHGNLIIGPNAVTQESKFEVSTSVEGLDEVLTRARKTWPEASRKGLITNFAGLRAKGANRDFVLGEAQDVPGFFNIACFESPGLTSAPAVAVDIAGQVAEALGAGRRANFNPRRKRSGRKLFAQMSDEERAEAIVREPEQGEIVCRCCSVSRGDLTYELKGILPVLCLDALKWRTGAMMGRCHAGFCSPEIMRIVHEHTGLPPEQMDKRLPGSPFVVESSAEYGEPQGDVAGNTVVNDPLASGYLCGNDVMGTVDPDAVVQTTAPGRQHGHGNDVSDTAASEYDVLVIGAGAAGMAAAVAARKEGAKCVALLDRESFLGGILRQCIHNGFGLTRFKKELTGPEYASLEEVELKAIGIDLYLDTTVLSLQGAEAGQGHTVRAVNRRGFQTFKAASVVLATGSRERGLGALNLAGSRPAGVFSAGSAQNLINLEGCLPGRRVIIQGSGDIGLIMARRCLYAGAEVLGVFARSGKPTGLSRNVRQCLDDYGIPFYGNRVVSRIEGEGRLDAVWISAVDPVTKQIIAGSEERWDCDTLLLSIGLLPENELASAAGIALDVESGGPVIDAWLQTSLAGVFACGNALHIHDLADDASEEGELAGRAAARLALGVGSEPSMPFPRRQELDSDLEENLVADVEDDSTPVPDLELICVRCPKGCELKLNLNPDGSLASIHGEGCRLGIAYAEEEITAPKRIVTASLAITGSLEPVSVKTVAPVLRTRIFEVLGEIKALRLHAPIAIGTQLVDDIAGTGVALIATKSVMEE